MASGNSWQVYQELGSPELRHNAAVEEMSTSSSMQILRDVNVNRAKTFSHRERKNETLSNLWQRRAISLKVAKRFGQKWLKKARNLLDDKGDEDDSLTQSTNDFTTASEYSEREEDLGAFYDAESDFKLQSVDFKRKQTRISLPGTFPDPNCPIHSRPTYRRHHSMHNQQVNSYRLFGDESLEDIANPSAMGRYQIQSFPNSELAAKLARKQKRAAMTPEVRAKVEKQKSKIIRNLMTISLAFLFLISAFQGLQNLQVSLNDDSGLGAISLSMIYTGLVVSCLFSPPYLLNRLGCKLTLILSMSVYSMYMLINFIPKWYSMIPGSLLLGFAAAPLWAAKCTYLTETGIRYAELNFESPNVVIVQFFGIFFMIVHLGQVFGNLISSYILSIGIDESGMLPYPPPAIEPIETTCGRYFAATNNHSIDATKNLSRPLFRSIYSLYGVYFCCTIVAILIVSMFLNQLKKDFILKKEKPRFKLEMWNTTIQHLKQPRHMLLIPLTIFNGMEQAFIAGEFTRAYVGCCLGIHKIGSVMTCFGACDAVCSLFFGPLIKLFGRMPLFMFGAVVDMLMIFTLLIWPPNGYDTALFYAVAACWGMADGVWSTQINGLWVVLFSQNLEVAFANYRLWESVGFIIGYTTIPFISVEGKLYLLLTVLLIGMLGYGLIETWEPLEVRIEDYSKRLKRKMHDFQPTILKRSRQENYPLSHMKSKFSANNLLKSQNQFNVDNPATTIHI